MTGGGDWEDRLWIPAIAPEWAYYLKTGPFEHLLYAYNRHVVFVKVQNTLRIE